jgi:hypothetical protein
MCCRFEVAGVASSAATVGHRFHHPGMITIGGAADYAEKLRACHVIVDGAERRAIIAAGATAAASAAGLELIEDEGLLFENAGLTEWPVPLLGRFDEAFLDVPPEVIQLTARVNQKYFVCRDGAGKLANAFVCCANIEAVDGGAKIVEGNRKVLAARLSDARFFYETDLKTSLAEQAKKLEKIVFHEKLGTVADKVERVAKLARWLVEEGIVTESLSRLNGEGTIWWRACPVRAQASARARLHQLRRTVPLPKREEDLSFRRPWPNCAGAAEQGRSRHRHGRRVPRTAGADGRLLCPRRRSAGCRRRCDPRSLQAGRAGRRRSHRAGDGGGEPGGQARYCFGFLRSINEPPTGSRDPFALSAANLWRRKLDSYE